MLNRFRALISRCRLHRHLKVLAKNEAWQLARLTDKTTGKLIEPAEAQRRFAGVMGDLMREAVRRTPKFEPSVLDLTDGEYVKILSHAKVIASLDRSVREDRLEVFFEDYRNAFAQAVAKAHLKTFNSEGQISQ